MAGMAYHMAPSSPQTPKIVPSERPRHTSCADTRKGSKPRQYSEAGEAGAGGVVSAHLGLQPCP